MDNQTRPCLNGVFGAAKTVGPHRNVPHLALIHHRLDLLHGIMLVHRCFPTPDTAAGGPNLNGVRILPQAPPHCFAQIPRAVHTFRPGMGSPVLVAGKFMGIAMAAGSAKAQTGGYHPGPLHYPLLDHVANGDAKPGNFAHSGQASLQTFMGLLHGDHRLLQVILQHPIAIVAGQVTGKVQMGVDQARHDGFTRNI